MNKYVVLIAMAILGLGWACQPGENESSTNAGASVEASPESSIASKEDLVKRGEYLVNVASCHDCHSPKVFTEQGPVPDVTRLLSGHPSDQAIGTYDPAVLKDWALFSPDLTAAVGPWGVSFAANLTSDDTGIGTWTEAQFLRAIREGKYKGMENGRPLLPPMPWPNVAQMTDDDLRAVFAYLKSTKPIRNIVPAPIPPAAVSMN